MTPPSERPLLSVRDPVWIGLGLVLLLFSALIVVEISVLPTYVDVKIEVDGFDTDWFEPERITIQLRTRDGGSARYFIFRRSAEICPLESGAGLGFETALQDWTEENNWEIVNPSLAYSCLDYSGLGLDLGEAVSSVITLKPLGWDEGMEWNATLCMTISRGDPCDQIAITSIVPSFGVMVGER